MDDGIGQKEGEGELREGNEGNARWGICFSILSARIEGRRRMETVADV